MSIRTFEAHVEKLRGAVMDVKVHGGSIITVPKLEGADYTTLLIVLMEPGKKKAVGVMTKKQFNEMTRDESTHDEPSGEQDVQDDVEFDTGYDWDGPMYPEYTLFPE